MGSATTPTMLTVRPAPNVQTFLSGSGTYTTPANAVWIHVRMVGGGGDGGGSNAGSSGSGGGAGGYIEHVLISPISSYAYIVGAATSLSSFIGGATNLVANGGASGVNPGTVDGALGGAGGTSSGGIINITGTNGGSSLGTAIPLYLPGHGGSSVFGGGGHAGGTSIGIGGAAKANTGSGGGGTAAAVNVPGAGAAGVIIVIAYFA